MWTVSVEVRVAGARHWGQEGATTVHGACGPLQGLWPFPCTQSCGRALRKGVMAHSGGGVGDTLKGTRAESGRCDLMVAGTKVTAGVTSLQILHAF